MCGCEEDIKGEQINYREYYHNKKKHTCIKSYKNTRTIVPSERWIDIYPCSTPSVLQCSGVDSQAWICDFKALEYDV